MNCDLLQSSILQIANNCQNKDKESTLVVENILGEESLTKNRKIISIEQTIAEMIEIKRQALEEKLGLEVFSKVWEEYFNGNKDIIEEFNSDIIEYFTDLVNYEGFFYSN